MNAITTHIKKLLLTFALFLIIAAIIVALLYRPSVQTYFLWNKEQFELAADYMLKVCTEENSVKYITWSMLNESELPNDVQNAMYKIFTKSNCTGIYVCHTHCEFIASKGDEDIGILFAEVGSAEEAKRVAQFFAVREFKMVYEHWYAYRVLNEDGIDKIPG